MNNGLWHGGESTKSKRGSKGKKGKPITFGVGGCTTSKLVVPAHVNRMYTEKGNVTKGKVSRSE